MELLRDVSLFCWKACCCCWKMPDDARRLSRREWGRAYVFPLVLGRAIIMSAGSDLRFEEKEALDIERRNEVSEVGRSRSS